ncbi:hypothetical protein RD792_001289 [Penstemon davidsonii]|uniref:Uncharacterized protein n=1 Tax=Penstemon davidsonii TaxID=160366 RepID=A0ABR0DN06_9LAMI|nr:hypothetical protein RD792_001289 [Penstemon davidsonii]
MIPAGDRLEGEARPTARPGRRGASRWAQDVLDGPNVGPKNAWKEKRYWENEKVRLDYRPVHMNTLDDEIETFPPKARVY